MNIRNAKLTILIVDDEFIFREINKRCIEKFLENKLGYEILTANGSQNALKIAQNRCIDIVLTDMVMDGREDSGIFLADRIKSFSPDTEVFIVSNADVEHIKKKTFGLNVSGCFQQLLHEADLKSAFRTFLHRCRDTEIDQRPRHIQAK